jgi:hypothetical protein
MKALFKAEAQRAKMERVPMLRNPFNPQHLIYNLTNSNGCGIL